MLETTFILFESKINSLSFLKLQTSLYMQIRVNLDFYSTKLLVLYILCKHRQFYHIIKTKFIDINKKSFNQILQNYILFETKESQKQRKTKSAESLNRHKKLLQLH